MSGKNRTMKFHNYKIIPCMLSLLLTSCATPKPAVHSSQWQSAGFKEYRLQTTPFLLLSQQKITAPGQDVTIYIEGDGHAWVSRYQLSTNPTPLDPLVRHWALRDPASNVAYLARPCQFVGTFKAPCTSTYWDNKRFAPEVVQSMNEAVTQIKHTAQAAQINLVGFSGGGAIAALIAARRDDVISLKTIAGNLDTELHSQLHEVSALSGSLNPRDVAPSLGHIKQVHYVGGKDKNIPLSITQSFVSYLPAGSDASIVIIPNATHNAGWND
jgi:predicted esterase